MDIVHADASLAEIGYINEIDNYDAEISQEIDAEIEANSFALTLPDNVWESDPIEVGHYVYIPGTEFGAVEQTGQHRLETLRYLESKIIAGDYLTIPQPRQTP